MDQDELQSRARARLGQAGETVYAAAHPGDELGPPGVDAPGLDPIVTRLNELEDLLGPGVGPVNTDEGLPKLREAVGEMEAILARPASEVPPPTENGRAALRHAINLLQQVERLYA